MKDKFEILFKILEVLLPAIITGVFTFFITRYTYNKNRPLDKIEIAYNRIYYPLYRIISDKNINGNINEVINKSKIYFTRYEKYIDFSTKRLFESLCKCTKEAKKKSIYRQFRNHIYNRNSYLRRRLGYLEPSFIQRYKSSSPSIKSLVRIFIGLCGVYILLFSCNIFVERFDTIFDISAKIFFIFLQWIICELIYCFFGFLYYKIRK